MVEVELVKPCVDEPDLYTVHGDLGVEVDLEELEGRLPEGSKCSKELGVARFSLGRREVTLYEDGFFDARKVAGEEDAEALGEELLDLVP